MRCVCRETSSKKLLFYSMVLFVYQSPYGIAHRPSFLLTLNNLLSDPSTWSQSFLELPQ